MAAEAWEGHAACMEVVDRDSAILLGEIVAVDSDSMLGGDSRRGCDAWVVVVDGDDGTVRSPAGGATDDEDGYSSGHAACGGSSCLRYCLVETPADGSGQARPTRPSAEAKCEGKRAAAASRSRGHIGLVTVEALSKAVNVADGKQVVWIPPVKMLRKRLDLCSRI